MKLWKLVRKLFSCNKAKTVARKRPPYLEGLEYRIVPRGGHWWPPVQAITRTMPSETIEPGDTVVASEITLSTTRGAARLCELRFEGFDIDVALQEIVSKGDLWLDRNDDGIFETWISSAIPTMNELEFDFHRMRFGKGRRDLDLAVTLDVLPGTTSDIVGIELTDVVATRGRRHLPVVFSGEATVHTIEQPTIEMLPTFYVTQRSLATTDTVVERQPNVDFLRFEARSEDGEALLTRAEFVAAQGSPLDVYGYSLWVDTDHVGGVDTILQDGVYANNGKVVFGDIIGGGYVVGHETVTFEVHGNISGSLSDSVFQLGFSDAPIGAEDFATGASLPDDHIVFVGGESTIFSLHSQGNLFVTTDTTPVRSDQILGGTSALVQRLTLHAEYEDIDTYRLVFQLLQGTTSTVDRLELFIAGDKTPFAFATINGAGDLATYSLNPLYGANMFARELIVPRGTELDILIHARLRTDINGAVSGETIQIGIFYVEARGDVSGNTLYYNDGDGVAEGEVFIGTTYGANQLVVSAEHTSVLSKIIQISNADPDTNGTAIPTGTAPIGVWQISAAPNSNALNGLNKVELDELTFKVQVSNVALDAASFGLYNKADSTTRSVDYVLTDWSGNILPQTGTISESFYVTFINLSTSPVDTQIDSGTDATFAILADILNAQVDPLEDSLLQLALETNSIEWFDRDFGASHLFSGITYPDALIRSTRYEN